MLFFKYKFNKKNNVIVKSFVLWLCQWCKGDRIIRTMLSAGLGYGPPGSGATPPYSPPPRNSPLPSFGFTQEQVACVCEV